MEPVTNENASKLSRIEQRKLKLAEYLAAKGRLKGPNPKPYLKERPVAKKPADSFQKVKIAGHEKENCCIGVSNGKEVKKKIAAEVDKNTSSRKVLNIHSQPKAPAQSSSYSRNACTSQKSTLQNPKQPHKAEKTAPSVPLSKRTNPQNLFNGQHKGHQARTTSHAANQTRKSCLASLPSQPGCGTSAHKRTNQTQCIKIESQSTRPLAKKLIEARIKPTSKIQTNNVSKTLKKPTQQPRNQSAVPNFGKSGKPSSLKTNSATNTSEVKQREGVSCIITKADTTGNNLHGYIKNRATRSLSKTQENMAQQPKSNPASKLGTHNSGSQSTKAMTRKSNSATNKSGVNQADATKTRTCNFSVQNKPEMNEGTVKLINATASAKLLGRKTRSCVLPQANTVPRELHQPADRSNQTKPAVLPKTPKSSVCPSTQGVRTAPVDGMKKPTAAQEERLRKLQEWRESRGITYKRPPMPVRVMRRKTVSVIPQPYWTNMENEDEVHDIVFAVDRSLDDCIKLLQQGFPVDQVKDVLSRVPMAQKFAKYWICQARLMEREGNLEVLSLFQEAVRVVREPVDELRSVIFEILKKRQIQGLSPLPKEPEAEETGLDDEREVGDTMCTPKPVGALICGMKGDSSVVKYKITATPGGKRSQQGSEPGQVDGHEIRFFTPVRRSVRIEKTTRRYPAALQEHDPCVTSLCDLAVESKEEVDGETRPKSSPVYVYRENEALRDHVHIKLVYPEEAET